ncbi:MAG: protoporphyrinogen oxidase HemJ [Chromatiaceae bacterium]|nr:protoporphyrinogen oxidase HemJ [Gammaproteobacteria bacterium]MCP5299949.1 protoporphyrinogen oxidase HemJ [Chromatiaceae bacterium]MCP5422023.1 protoporphyrinogen oxidase HemJ [Chromatiaceae bacterium]
MMWLKAWHLIGMVTWFAGLFYLPRLFVYHAMSDDAVSIERFKVMERKLFFGITTPGGIFTLIFGLWMLYDYAWTAYSAQLWLHVKLALIVVLVAYHAYCGKLLLDFKYDRNTRSHVWYRWFNELPVLLLVAIVLLAVLKPF